MGQIIEWTGKPPEVGVCPGMTETGALCSLPQVTLSADRKTMQDYFDNTWTLTEVLFSGLANEDAFYRRPYHHLRHPLIFYYGHPAVLYINKLRVAGLLEKGVDADLEHLLETGVDEMRWDDLHEGNQSIWPSIARVRDYRKKVYKIVSELIQTHPGLENKNLPITQENPLWALVMGFEHERIHLETSSVLMRELPLASVQKPKQWPASKKSLSPALEVNSLISVEGGQVELGKPHDWPTFGWDNEYGRETRSYANFSASKFLISNAEYLDFVKDAGYSNQTYWSADGWGWRSFRNIKHPTFWVPEGPAGLHQYKLRTVFELIDLPLDWPVCVNYYEAKAYCAWKSKKDQVATPYRLLSEAEHHAIRAASTAKKDLQLKRDPILAKDFAAVGNMNFSTGSESPVNAYPANDKGFHDSFGNLWQWCEDAFHPLKEGKPHPYYEDFSAPCYDGQHQMILGGSFASTGDESSIWARFHFRPHFFQHAGFRLVQSEKVLSKGAALYESTEMINRYLLMHWGSNEDVFTTLKGLPPQVVHLPLKCAELVKQYSKEFGKALDLGCAVGRSAFELAKDFKQVLGIDYSHEFIDCAKKLRNEKMISYWRKDSGDKGVQLTATVDPSIDLNRLSFQQGDACALPEEIHDFDAVLLANVLCRLPDPQKGLERMQGAKALVKPGGVLVMTTPFSWLEDYTPREKWLNGIPDVQKVLTDFELIHQEELPFMIREHARKFEYIITLASVWRRKS